MKQSILHSTVMLLAAMAAGYFGGLMSQSQHHASAADQPAVQEVVRTKKLELVDAAGKTRGVFNMVNDDPNLCLYDSAGKGRGAFSLIKSDPSLYLWDAKGIPRAAFVLKNGEPYIGIGDDAGNRIWSATPQTQAISAAVGKAVILPAGFHTVGKDIGQGRYRVTATGMCMFTVRGADDRIKFFTSLSDPQGNKTNVGVDEYICNLANGDEIEIGAPCTFMPIN